MTNRQVIKIRNASLWRGTTKVFANLCLEINAGENTAIIGPNGAGKTTLLKLFARELYPSSGSLEIYGKERWNVWELRKRLGIVSADLQQNYSPTANGFTVVLSGFFSSNDIFDHQSFDDQQIAIANQTTRDLGIGHLRDQPFSQMSTGEQRRHLLARALVNDPETLILDEPTAGLDLAAMFRTIDTLRHLMRGGKTVVLVTHHIHEIPPEINNVVLIKDGTIVAQGHKSEMLTEQRLSHIFDVSVKVVSANGFYQVFPA